MKEWLALFKNVDTGPFLTAYDNANKKETDITDRSTQGEKSKQINISPDSLEAIGWLFNNYVKKVNHVKVDNLELGNCWYVEGGKGSYHRLHNHTLIKEGTESGEGLACVLYLDVPNDEDRGEFYFLIRDKDNTKLNSLMPNKGDLIIMPKTVYHGVYPQKSEGLRRTLNFDFAYAS